MLLTGDLLYKFQKQPIVGWLKCVNGPHAADVGLYFTHLCAQCIVI